MSQPDLKWQLQKMRKEWDARAKENARYYVNTARASWTDAEFFSSGEQTVAEEILTDMTNICQGRNPREMRVLEIGCGVGRVTLPLSHLFGEVYGVDISSEMIRQAGVTLAGRPNARVFQNNGMDLTVLPDVVFDFAFSTIVFQHIPRREVIESYVREVCRVLRPGALFKFQVQGYTAVSSSPDNTWLGVPFTDEEAVDMGTRNGFDPRYRIGAGEQHFWLWFFKNPELPA